MAANSSVDLLLEGITLHVDAAVLKSRLNKCDASLIQNWKNDHGFDLVHFCILENNIVALVLLLSQGFFKPPHEPTTWPYLHLVACMGFKSLISTVVQEMKFQNEALLLDWTAYHACIEKKVLNAKPHLLSEKDKVRKLTPVDLAAYFNHSACVRLLLDFWQVQSKKQLSRYHSKSNVARSNSNRSPTMYLSLACKVNSPMALRLLLQEDPDKKEALECSVRLLAPECVDIVLRDGGLGGGDMGKVFQGMNLFHVLYSYSSYNNIQHYENMVEITSILLRHDQNVNAIRPSRTFPLYSLISHRGGVGAGCGMQQRAPFLLAALLLLLKAGANPNVDEIRLEGRLCDDEHSTAFGRGPHSSAAHCLISNLPHMKANAFEDAVVTNPVDEFCYKCLELLLRHGADFGSIGRFRPFVGEEAMSIFPRGTVFSSGTVLHTLLSSRSLSFINYPVLRFILNYGVDADARGICTVIPHLRSQSKALPSPLNMEYAINLLPFSIWGKRLLSILQVDTGDIETRRSNTQQAGLHSSSLQQNRLSGRDVKHVLYTARFMSQPALVCAFREFTLGVQTITDYVTNQMDNLRDESVAQLLQELSDEDSAFRDFVRGYEQLTREPWKLQKCCSHAAWVACRQHLGNIYSLPIPGPLRKVILSFF